MSICFSTKASRLATIALCSALGACTGTILDAPNFFEPFEPPEPEAPLVDRPFLQEINHTTNEVEPGAEDLIAALIPPDSLSGFETPTLVTSSGLVGRELGGAAFIAAAFLPTGLVLTSTDTLYWLASPSGSVETRALPSGTTVHGLTSGQDRVYLLTSSGVGWTTGEGVIEWGPATDSVTAAVEAGALLIVATGQEVRAQPISDLSQTTWTLTSTGIGPIRAMVADVRVPQPMDLVLVGDEGLSAVDLSANEPSVLDVPELEPGRVPLGHPIAAARASDGGFIVAADGGAYRIMERGDGPEWRVYNAERWLPSREVRSVATDPDLPDGPIFFATAKGLATVSAKRMTLEEKLDPFVARVVERHDRDGAVADSHLTVRGDLSSNIPWDSDNDGGWTCYWVLAECFRYKVTGDPKAKEHFDRSLERMLSFRTLTGTDYFVARSVIRKDGCRLDDCDDPDDGEWFTSPDGEWWVKGDTSNDEVTSHMFMMGHAYDLCADETQRASIRAHVDGIAGGIVDHGYQLFDVDGKVTNYGQFDPHYVNETVPGMLGDGGHRSVQLLGILTLAYYLTGDSKYESAKRDLIETHHYDQNALTEADYPFRAGSGDGDELVTQAFVPLIRYEVDEERRALWIRAWRHTYEHLRLQQGAFWDLINALMGGDDVDFSAAGRWLRLAPVDFIRWDMENSQRLDLIAPPDYYDQKGAMRSDGRIIPYDERRLDRWNTDQFKVDGGMGGWIEMDGADVLMPYWMGRYYGFIIEE